MDLSTGLRSLSSTLERAITVLDAIERRVSELEKNQSSVMEAIADIYLKLELMGGGANGLAALSINNSETSEI